MTFRGASFLGSRSQKNTTCFLCKTDVKKEKKGDEKKNWKTADEKNSIVMVLIDVEWFPGSTDSIARCIGLNDPVTALLHILLGKNNFSFVYDIGLWKLTCYAI